MKWTWNFAHKNFWYSALHIIVAAQLAPTMWHPHGMYVGIEHPMYNRKRVPVTSLELFFFFFEIINRETIMRIMRTKEFVMWGWWATFNDSGHTWASCHVWVVGHGHGSTISSIFFFLLILSWFSAVGLQSHSYKKTYDWRRGFPISFQELCHSNGSLYVTMSNGQGMGRWVRFGSGLQCTLTQSA